VINSWQESQFCNRTLQGEFDYELNFEAEEIRKVIDGNDSEEGSDAI
jgi:hypothetical protein